MDIQVGDLVTYKNETKFNILKKVIVNESELDYYQNQFNNKSYELLKIERPKYEVIEEHKELLTEEEKEFLKDLLKYHHITRIQLTNNNIEFYNNYTKTLILKYSYINKRLKFSKLEKYINYSIEELEIE